MTCYRVLLPHPLEPRLLVLGSHGEWRLPTWDDPAPRGWQETAHVNRAIAARFGMETTVLSCLRELHRPEHADVERVYELENHSAAHDVIPASTWIGEAELELLHVPDPGTRELMQAWFSRQGGELSLHGPPWSRQGWFVEALAWSIARLRVLGVNATRPPEQLRASRRSFVMRIEAPGDTFYFRAASLMFSHEPRLMQWLARRYPLNVPEVLKADAERGWLLLREVPGGDRPLREEREPEVWNRAVRRLAEIQIDTVDSVAELRMLGVPYRGLDVLARRIPHLCGDSSALLLGHPAGLTRREIDQVANLAPAMLALCDELRSINLPDCLDYGDLHASSVFGTFADPAFLDWSLTSVSHPFFSVWPLLTDAIRLIPASSGEAQRRLRDAFLAPWRDLAPHDTLVRAFAIARCLAPLHHAATVHAELLPETGFTWELEPVIPQLLRSTLAAFVDHDTGLLA
jgi:hypothetical protein